MRSIRTTRRTLGVAQRAAFAGLALGVSLFGAGAGAGAVLAEGAGIPGLVPADPSAPGTAAPPAADPDPAGAAEVPPAPGTDAVPLPPGADDAARPADDEPAPPPDPTAPPGNLFPEETGPAPDVSNVSLTGEAYTVRQDLKAPLEAHLGRYPRATTDVASDLTTAFGAFADPGFLGRFAARDNLGPADNRDVEEPTWAECVYPKSPLTPQEDVRSPGEGAALTAVARCYQGAGQAAGYYARDPGPDKTAGVPVFSAAGAAAVVEAASNAAGATVTSSMSTLEDVNIAQQVKIRSITNEVIVRTNGRPGGSVVDTAATIAGLSIFGTPVELPSDSLEKLGPTLAELPPVLTPLGMLTFDVIPAQEEAAPDGTLAAGRAAQLLVTLENGETTVTFGLGFASARGRTILNEFTVPGVAGSAPPGGFPRVRDVSGPQQPLRFGYANPGSRFTEAAKAAARRSAARRLSSAPSARITTPSAPTGFGPGAIGGLPTTGLDVALPPPVGGTGETEAYGGDGPWLALIGGSIIALALARYLAYSTALRPAAA